jgi:predicted DNA-binding protein with PD1-like motif
MRYTQGRQGRVFVIRLEHGETVHKEIENFARAHAIRAASLIILGGADGGSRFVVGPEKKEERPINPMEHIINDVHEVSGTGTLFQDEDGNPMLHMHMSCGRGGSTLTGCIRGGVLVWQVMEIVMFEIVDTNCIRIDESELGFKLLLP